MNNKLLIGLKSFIIIALAISIYCMFGYNSIIRFVFKKVLFTPYNIVGIIITIAAICGWRINRKESHRIKLALTILNVIASLFSYACTICSWFNINLLNLIWIKALKPAVVSVGTVILWILIVIVGIAVISYTIYGVYILIVYKKEKWKRNCGEEQDWKEKSKLFEKSLASIQETRLKSSKYKTSNFRPKMITKPKVRSNTITKWNTLQNNYESSIAKNRCPICGGRLKRRINRKTGKRFIGCSNFGYHNCTFTISEFNYGKILKKKH